MDKEGFKRGIDLQVRVIIVQARYVIDFHFFLLFDTQSSETAEQSDNNFTS